MKNYLTKEIMNDHRLIKYPGVRHIISNLISGLPYILSLISPDFILKSNIIKDIYNDYKSTMSQELSNNFKILCAEVDADYLSHMLEEFTSKTELPSEMELTYIYYYYAQENTLPDVVVSRLYRLLKELDSKNRLYFLINSLIFVYCYDESNFDLAEKHIKSSMEFISSSGKSTEYEAMVMYLLCGKYMETSRDIFVSGAGSYYALAIDAAEKLKDNIAQCTILNCAAYYYHNIEEKDKALLIAKKSFSLSQELDIVSVNFSTYKILSILYLTFGDYEKARNFINKATVLSKSIEDFSSMETARLLNTLGYTYYMNGKFKEALDCHLQALKSLSTFDSVSVVLDETIKTCDNLSTSCKMLGDMKRALYFSNITTKIIENINFVKKTNDIHNLCKQYTDMGILYGLYLNDYKNAKHYYSLAKATIHKHDHYIKWGNLQILESYIKFHEGFLDESRALFEKACSTFAEHGRDNIYVQNLLISYYLYFATIFISCKKEFAAIAEKIASKSSLTDHLKLYFEYFIDKRYFEAVPYNEKDYALNLVLMISEERKHALMEGKKSKDFELVQSFSNAISSSSQESDLFQEAESIFSRHFLSKGLAVIKHNFNEGFNTKVLLEEDFQIDKTVLKKELEEFLTDNNLTLNYNSNGYDIFINKGWTNLRTLKSLLVFYIYDEISSNTYYFVLFNERKCDWFFSEEEAEAGLILIKNMFLKLKNIHYTENIKNKSLTDQLTGLYNAKYLWSKLDSYIEDYNVTGATFSMVLMDLNDFKAINDTYGHSVGDDAIRFFSQILRIGLNPYTEIIRYGGDEFVVIFPNLDKEEGERLINRISDLCRIQPFMHKESRIKISFSYGMDTYSSHWSPMEFFNNVDKLMYTYKQELKRLG